MSLIDQYYPSQKTEQKKNTVVNTSATQKKSLIDSYYPSPQPQPTQQPQPQQTIFTKTAPVIGKVLDFAKNVIKEAPQFIKSTAKAVKKEPIEVARGAGKSLIIFGGEIAGFIQKAAANKTLIGIGDIGIKTPATIPERWDITKQTTAFKELDNMRLDKLGMDAKRANEVGNFLGSFIPYTLASEITATTIGAKVLLPTASKWLPKAIKFIPQINNAIGFLGLGQLEYDKKVDQSRVDRAKNDLIMLGLFEAGGALVKGLTKGTKNLISKTINKISKDIKSEKGVDINVVEQEVKVVKEAIKKDTRKSAEVVLAENMVKAPEPKVQETGVDINLVKEAIGSGDIEGAKALYDDLPKGTYKPSFESLKQSVARGEERQAAQFANEGVKAVKENYGQYQDTVQKMKNFLRISAEKKNSEGTLFREHIPQKNFGISSDEIATDLGMTENQFMEKILSELDIQKQAVPKVAKDVGVPRSQLPLGEGKEKLSRLEARVTESLEKTPQEAKEQLGLSTFNQMSKKENIKKAVEYVTNNTSEAMTVLRGEREVPQGLLRNSIYVAMENLSKDNTELARKLASLQSTRFGQELSILTEIDPNSPVKIMRDIVVIREEAFKARYGGRSIKEVSDKIVGDIQKKVKIPYDWNNFIKSLPTC